MVRSGKKLAPKSLGEWSSVSVQVSLWPAEAHSPELEACGIPWFQPPTVYPAAAVAVNVTVEFTGNLALHSPSD